MEEAELLTREEVLKETAKLVERFREIGGLLKGGKLRAVRKSGKPLFTDASNQEYIPGYCDAFYRPQNVEDLSLVIWNEVHKILDRPTVERLKATWEKAWPYQPNCPIIHTDERKFIYPDGRYKGCETKIQLMATVCPNPPFMIKYCGYFDPSYHSFTKHIEPLRGALFDFAQSLSERKENLEEVILRYELLLVSYDLPRIISQLKI